MTLGNTVDMFVETQQPLVKEYQEVVGYHFAASRMTFLSIAPRITSLLSILGGLWIVMEVWVYSNKKHYVYHKIVSAMAFYSILVCVSYFLADWASLGSSSACRMQGFFVQLSVAPLLYFAVLFLYYVLVLSFSFPEHQLTSTKILNLPCHRVRLSWQQIFHVMPCAASVLTATASVPLDLFHPSMSTKWCWIAVPSRDEIENQDEQFRNVPPFQWGFYLGPSWLAFGVMILALFVVFRAVESQEERMKKYVTAKSFRKSDNDRTAASKKKLDSGTTSYNHGSRGNVSTSSRNDETSLCSVSQSTVQQDVHTMAVLSSSSVVERGRMETIASQVSPRFSLVKFSTREYWEHRPRTRQVLVQCGCYVSACFWSIVFITINEIVAQRTKIVGIPYALIALQSIFQPLLGFHIFLAYRRPFYMRMRRQGLSRWEALLTSLKWNQNPIDPPGRNVRLLKRSHNLNGNLSNEGIQLTRRQGQPRSIVKWMQQSFQYLFGTVSTTTQKVKVEKVQEISPFHDFPGSPIAFAHPEEQLDKSIGNGITTDIKELMESGRDNPSSECANGSESFSTRGTNTTSAFTKDDSLTFTGTKDFSRLPKKSSSQSFGNHSDNDDDSISLEDLIDRTKTDGDHNEQGFVYKREGDIESQQQGDLFGISMYRVKDALGDIELMQRSSDLYQDLVFLDIIPEANGEIEEIWRSVEAKMTRYRKTNQDKHKLHMSVPVLSERNFDSNPSLPGLHGSQRKDSMEIGEYQSKARFAWLKNPLFKVSERRNSNECSPDRPRQISEKSRGTVRPKRTSSGGYFSKPSKVQADESFMDKLKRERSRQEMLQAISSRRLHRVEFATNENLHTMLRSSGAAMSKDRHQPTIEVGLEGKQSNLSFSNPLLDAGVDSDSNCSEESGQRQVETPIHARDRWATVGSDWVEQEAMKLADRRGNPSLDNISEVSEHPDKTIASSKRDRPPMIVQKRLSSDEMILRSDGNEVSESSNEFTVRSTGSSIHTIKRSNGLRHHRKSNSSFISSDEVSLVSDGPLSDDDYLSDSSSHDDLETRTSGRATRQNDSSTDSSCKTRISLGEMQRVSERSIEEKDGSPDSPINVDACMVQEPGDASISGEREHMEDT